MEELLETKAIPGKMIGLLSRVCGQGTVLRMHSCAPMRALVCVMDEH